MDGVKEYIFPVYDVDADEYKEYIGFIRSKPELIRCKDCKNNPSTLIGWIECPMTGAGTRQPNDFCSYAEPKEKSNDC